MVVVRLDSYQDADWSLCRMMIAAKATLVLDLDITFGMNLGAVYRPFLTYFLVGINSAKYDETLPLSPIFYFLFCSLTCISVSASNCWMYVLAGLPRPFLPLIGSQKMESCIDQYPVFNALNVLDKISSTQRSRFSVFLCNFDTIHIKNAFRRFVSLH